MDSRFESVESSLVPDRAEGACRRAPDLQVGIRAHCPDKDRGGILAERDQVVGAEPPRLNGPRGKVVADPLERQLPVLFPRSVAEAPPLGMDAGLEHFLKLSDVVLRGAIPRRSVRLGLGAPFLPRRAVCHPLGGVVTRRQRAWASVSRAFPCARSEPLTQGGEPQAEENNARNGKTQHQERSAGP